MTIQEIENEEIRRAFEYMLRDMRENMELFRRVHRSPGTPKWELLEGESNE